MSDALPQQRFSVDNTLTPVSGKMRVQALDVIRGLSILGILAVNADGFAAPISASLNPTTWPYPNTGVTAISYWIMDAFFHEKFVTLFSMLFGVSLFLVGGDGTDAGRNRIAWRRLAVLFLFAMLHGFGIWWGDILSLYACTGVIMLFCRGWPARRLMVVGVALYLAMAVRPLVEPIWSPHPPAMASAPAAQTAAAPVRPRPRIIAAMHDATSSWAGAYRQNTRSYLRVISGYPWLLPSTLGLMMIGLSLFKSGFLSGRRSGRLYAATLGIGAGALAASAGLAWMRDIDMRPIAGDHVLVLVLAPPAALGYAAGLILMLRTSAARFLKPLAAAGRMAFTNYLTQSLIMTSIFYGGRGALMGQADRSALWGIVLAIWALQLLWSSLWLSRFDMGPFEWLWRWATYWKRPPFFKPRLAM